MPLGPVIAGMRYKISIQSELVESRACVRASGEERRGHQAGQAPRHPRVRATRATDDSLVDCVRPNVHGAAIDACSAIDLHPKVVHGAELQ